MKTACLLVDDEPLALEIIASYLEKLPDMDVVATCKDASSAFSTLRTRHIDLLFLDIHMPGLDGISLLKSLHTPPAVIFTTAYREYAIESYELQAVDYLMKPISFERFLKAIDRYYSLHQGQNHGGAFSQPNLTPAGESIFIRTERKMVKVLLNEIIYIESLKDYIIIHLAAKKLITKTAIGQIKIMLPEEKFLRIHRSYIISVNKITAYNSTDIELGNTELPIGRLYKNAVLRQLSGKVASLVSISRTSK
ncbi:MAG: response regulator transcription factor [Ignavibacteria bacterium]|nr:response regulator transcription factor [Ignavibacteria bacterium]